MWIVICFDNPKMSLFNNGNGLFLQIIL